MRSRNLPLSLLLLASLAACSPAATESTVPAQTTTTVELSVRSTAESPVTVDDAVDASLAAALVDEVDRLRAVTETLRGLGFIGPPRIAILSPANYAQRRAGFVESFLDAPALAAETRLYRMLGLLDPSQDLRTLLRSGLGSRVPAYYDAATKELVVEAVAAPLAPGDRSVVVRELVRLLTDQYHDHSGRIQQWTEEGLYDEALALGALAGADAVYTQLRYVDQLSPDDSQAAIETAAVAEAPGPDFLADELAFTGQEALAFVALRLEQGGFAYLDEAYGSVPTTERLLHPIRFAAGEIVLEVPVPAAVVDGYELVDEGTLGELRLRGLLSAALPAGMQTQVSDGWGGDRYMLFADPEDVALVYTFRGDTVDDTVEVAQAFLDHAAFVMGMAEPVAVGGGVEFVGLAPPEDEVETDTEEGASDGVNEPAGPYAYVDRSGDGLVVVISSSVEAGRALGRQVQAP